MSTVNPDILKLSSMAMKDLQELTERDKTYGSSWKKRGGIGAFMMLARKADRIMAMSQGSNDLVRLWMFNPGDVRDDFIDLRRYLILVEGEYYQTTIPHGNVKADPYFGCQQVVLADTDIFSEYPEYASRMVFTGHIFTNMFNNIDSRVRHKNWDIFYETPSVTHRIRELRQYLYVLELMATSAMEPRA